jgi:homeobox-leucine zipper protein
VSNKIWPLFELSEVSIIQWFWVVLQIRELKAKLQEDNTVGSLSVKEEIVAPESDNNLIEQSKAAPDTPPLTASDSKELNFCFNQSLGAASLFTVDHFKDGSSDSDSSAILNEDNSPNAAISSSGVLQNQQQLMGSFNCSSSSPSPPPPPISCFQFQKTFSTQYVKMEEHNFFSAEETCNIFSDEQAPTLPWYCPDQWT